MIIEIQVERLYRNNESYYWSVGFSRTIVRRTFFQLICYTNNVQIKCMSFGGKINIRRKEILAVDIQVYIIILLLLFYVLFFILCIPTNFKSMRVSLLSLYQKGILFYFKTELARMNEVIISYCVSFFLV